MPVLTDDVYSIVPILYPGSLTLIVSMLLSMIALKRKGPSCLVGFNFNGIVDIQLVTLFVLIQRKYHLTKTVNNCKYLILL